MYKDNMYRDELFAATATYDGTTGKIFASIICTALFFSKGHAAFVTFSKGDSVLLIKEGSSYVAKVEEIETSNDTTTLALSVYERLTAYLWLASESEEQVLLSPLPRSILLEKPFATIDVQVNLNSEALLELKEGVTFAQACEIIGLNSSSQVTVNFNLGNPETTVETFVADNVNAIFSTKGFEIVARRIYGRTFVSDQPIGEVSLYSYLQAMRRQILHDQDQAFHYTVTAIDENSKVLLHNEPIIDMLAYKRNGERTYSIRLENPWLFGRLKFSGNCTLIIEKATVNKADYLSWYGDSQPRDILTVWNQKNYETVYSKKYDGNNTLHLELSMNLLSATRFLSSGASDVASLTVANKTIFGNLELTQDNKFVLTKPKEVKPLAWAKDLAALQSSGKGYITPLEQGSPAKDETLQLKVGLDNVENALNVFKALQNTPSPTVDQLLSIIGVSNVTDAEENDAKAEVNVLTATMTLATGTVGWYANCFEITVTNDSNEMVKVFNSNGVNLYFKEVNFAQFFEAAVDDINNNYKDILNNTSAVFTWRTANVRTTGGEMFVLRNAEVDQTKDGKTFKFFYEGLGWAFLAQDTLRFSTLTFTITEKSSESPA